MKKGIVILLFLILYLNIAFAANDIWWDGDVTGQDRYCRIIAVPEQTIWDGDSLEASPAWADTAMQCSENTTIKGYYYITSMQSLSVGDYLIISYAGAYDSATSTDFVITSFDFCWDGSYEFTLEDINDNFNEVFSDFDTIDADLDNIITYTGTNIPNTLSIIDSKIDQTYSEVIDANSVIDSKISVLPLNIWSYNLSSISGDNKSGYELLFLRDILEGDSEIITSTTPWQTKILLKGTDTELVVKDLKDVDGNNITDAETYIGQNKEP